MLQLKDICYSIGDKEIIKSLDWNINSKERLALIGDNGAGKTTLFKIIIGQIGEYKGSINKLKNLKIGYLPQEEIITKKGTVLNCVLSGVGDLLNLKKKISGIYQELSRDISLEKHDELLRKAGNLEMEFDVNSGYEIEIIAKKILTGLGFTTKEFDSPLKKFSGGWRMRAYLARLLIQKPDLLLLDEPTNHLDLPALEWLEQYLLDFKGCMVIVSHDRFFIDKLANKIYQLKDGRVLQYPGNYTFYINKKRAENELNQKKYKNYLNEKKHIEEFIARNRVRKDRAAQVQSRIKQLDKTEDFNLLKSKKSFHFSLGIKERSYNHVLDIKRLSFRYNQKNDWVLRDLDLDLYRDEKVALVGKNGTGKTTLTSLITNLLIAETGTLKVGERVKIRIYSQHQIDTLNLSATVFEEVCSVADSNTYPGIRDILGIFHFSDEDVKKKIQVLSGGEKARVSLVKILISSANFLIMDEPTNHLDHDSKEALELALQKYTGTLLLISHDRYFLDKIVHRVVELKGGKMNSFPGNYSNYLEKKNQMRTGEEKTALKINKKKNLISEALNKKQIKQIQAGLRQEESKKRKKLDTAIKKIEEEIESLEREKDLIDKKMLNTSTYDNKKELIEIQKRYSFIKKRLAVLFIDWGKIHSQIEDLLLDLRNKQAQVLIKR